MIGTTAIRFDSVPYNAGSPMFVGNGGALPTLASGASTINPAYPAGVRQGDFCLMVLECGGESTVTTTPPGWEEIDTARSDVATTAGSRLRVFWQFFPRAYAVQQGTTAPLTISVVSGGSLDDHGDHTMAAILAWRGVNSTTPFDVGSLWSSSSSAVSSVQFPEITTATANALVVCIATRPNDSSSVNFGAITPGNLTQTAERLDTGATAGHGGGLYVMEGRRNAAGAIGTVSVAKTTATSHVSRTIALRPA